MTETQKIKSKGPLRLEAIIPVAIILTTIILYSVLFLDHHLRAALEMIGYEVMGAEVNIAKLETSFTHGSIRIQGIQITNPDKPDQNLVAIGDIRFGVLWDGLLRAKIVIEEMDVEQIEVGNKRDHTGKVKPPPPPPKPSNNTALKNEAAKLEKTATNAVQAKTKNNVLGDIAGVLNSSGGSDDALKNIEKNLPSKKALDEFSAELQAKQKKWDEKLKTLPQSKEIEALGQRLSQVKTSSFKNPQEVVENLQKIQAIAQEADTKYKSVTTIANEFNSDLSASNNRYKEIDAMMKKDIADLETRFHIPKIDAKSLTMGILDQYLSSYIGKFNQYLPLLKNMAPKNKGKDVSMQPRPRSKGVTYEFGHANSYPLFWLKKVSVSSKANASKFSGNLSGLITDISSNQLLTQKPTVMKLNGDFPGLEITGLSAQLNIDNRSDSLVAVDFAVGSYGIEGRDILASDDGKISFKKATGSMKSSGTLTDLKTLSFNLDNKVEKIDYEIKAQNPTIDEILKSVFAGIPVVTIAAKATGELPDFNLNVDSNIGSELQKGFEKQINKKVEELKSKLNLAIQQAIGAEKSKVEGNLNQMKSQADSQIKKVQDQLNAEKTKAEKKSEQSKNDSQKQGEKQLQDAAQKKLDDLKKQFGL